jgi:putative ABC transport system permease protein
VRPGADDGRRAHRGRPAHGMSSTGQNAGIGWRTAWTIARRDLQARFRGLRLLLVCLFLGTGALAAIGTLTSAIERELTTSGGRAARGACRSASGSATCRRRKKRRWRRSAQCPAAQGCRPWPARGEATAPVELKAIDAVYPLYGRSHLADGRSVRCAAAGTGVGGARRARPASIAVATASASALAT